MTDIHALMLLIDALRLELRAAALLITGNKDKVWGEAGQTIEDLKKEADDTAQQAWDSLN